MSSGALCAYLLNVYPPDLYGIVVDAGSVHTAVYSYRYHRYRWSCTHNIPSCNGLLVLICFAIGPSL